MKRLIVITDWSIFNDIINELSHVELTDIHYESMDDLCLIYDWTILSKENQNKIMSLDGVRDITGAYLGE